MQLLREVDEGFYYGMRTGVVDDEFRKGEVAFIMNARPSARGGVCQPIGDFEGVGRPTAGIPYGLVELTTAAGAKQLVEIVGDTAYYSTDEGANWSAIAGATGLREDYWSFAIYREGSSNVLCCANGGTSAYQYDGTTWSTISNIPSGTKYLEVLGDRLIAAGGSGVTVAASKVSDIDNGYGATSGGWTVKATTHDGDVEITGLFTLGSVLLVFKQKSVGYIEGFGYQTLQVAAGARGLSRSVGCVAHRTIAPLGDDGVAWLSRRGVESYRVGGRVTLISHQVQEIVDSVHWAHIEDAPGEPSAIWVEGLQEYWCSLPLGVPGCEWLYAYRPPRLSDDGVQLPAVHYLILPGTIAAQATVAIDSEQRLIRGATWSSLDVRHQWMTVDADERLGIAIGPAVGGQLTQSEQFELQYDYDSATESPPRSLAMATRSGEPKPCFGAVSGYVVWAEEPRTSPVTVPRWEIVGRPYAFGDHFVKKKAKVVGVIGAANAPSVLAQYSYAATVRVAADGAYGTDRFVSFGNSVGQPDQKHRRVGGRGNQMQVYMSSNVNVSVHGYDLHVQLLKERP